MKVRAITIGIDPGIPLHASSIAAAGRFAARFRAECEAIAIPVQTVRVATPPFPSYLHGQSEAAVQRYVKELQDCCQAHGMEYCSIGPVNPQREEEQRLFAMLPTLIAETQTIFASVVLAASGQPLHVSTGQAIAQAIHTIAQSTDEGFGNLRFAAVVNCGPHIPFFPAAYHAGEAAISLALEAADIVAAVAQPDRELGDFRTALVAEFERQVLPLQQLAQRLEGQGFVFRGIDISPAPGPGASIAYAMERCGLGRFGEPGTLAVAAQITAALKATSLHTCGYCGLMLPVLEDVGLAERNDQGLLRLSTLLSYSAVCGTGLDTIPVAGDVSIEKLTALLVDVAALGWKLRKPLSARLLPIPGKQAGDKTNFDFAYFVNTRVMDIE
jgi:uncharacterized protein (UPF0210 family)